MTRPPSASTTPSCSREGGPPWANETCGPGASWSVPTPQASSPPTARAWPMLRWVSSRATGQSRPLARRAGALASSRGAQGLGELEPEPVEVFTESQRAVPIDHRRCIPGVDRGPRVDDHMRSGVDAAVERAGPGRWRGRRRHGAGFEGGGLDGPVDVRKTDVHGVLQGLGQRRPRMWSAAFSATMMVGALVLQEGTKGITDASTTRKPSMPMSFRSGATTLWASLSGPIRQVPTGWWSVLAWAQA